ncbi:DUF1707 SHOCT-like domain-containing protein [Actinomycetospora cinnamomea]|uniref:DUF1707 SHOCT-like domain-containing protein n=1 Tax=Actinomycetospora cinnamomea TaxID=663609 RepID=UPI001A9C5B59|nr:DUF1707 domain-containing protein [Actinomycetospora cinnamomea]
MDGTGRLRVADVDRERVAARLAQAHAEGRLTLREYDERVRAAHGAVVVADLAPLTADLPDLPDAAPPRDRAPRRPGPSPLRAAVAVWAAVSALNVVIWLAVVAGTAEPVAPWWIWVAGPWGLVLAVGALAGRVGLPLPGPCGSAPLRR